MHPILRRDIGSFLFLHGFSDSVIFFIFEMDLVPSYAALIIYNAVYRDVF